MITVLVILGILTVVASAATIRALRTDGYRRIPTDWRALTPDRGHGVISVMPLP